MQKKKVLKLGFLLGLGAALASCTGQSSWWNEGQYEYFSETNDYMFGGEAMSAADASFYAGNPDAAAKVYNKRVPPLNSLIVCRDKQCAPASLSMSREYIYNALTHIIDNNLDTTALLCEANPQAHICTNPYLTVPAKVGVTPAYVFFDGVKIVDASLVKGKTALNLALGYNLSYNGQTPSVCKPDKAMIYVKNNNSVVLNGTGFKCDMTSVGTTTIRIMFNVDYIDLDYGYIGGYYSVGLSGPANGGGSGYGMIRLQKDAHPLAPELTAIETEKEKPAAMMKPMVKPEVNPEVLAVPPEADVVPAAKSKKAEAKKSNKKPEQKFSSSQTKAYTNPRQPLKITPDTVVKSDRVILKPEEDDIKPVEVEEGTAPVFEEVYVEDLDDYIK